MESVQEGETSTWKQLQELPVIRGHENKESLSGLAFDHDGLPKIAAVHTLNETGSTARLQTTAESSVNNGNTVLSQVQTTVTNNKIGTDSNVVPVFSLDELEVLRTYAPRLQTVTLEENPNGSKLFKLTLKKSSQSVKPSNTVIVQSPTTQLDHSYFQTSPYLAVSPYEVKTPVTARTAGAKLDLSTTRTSGSQIDLSSVTTKLLNLQHITSPIQINGVTRPQQQVAVANVVQKEAFNRSQVIAGHISQAITGHIQQNQIVTQSAASANYQPLVITGSVQQIPTINRSQVVVSEHTGSVLQKRTLGPTQNVANSQPQVIISDGSQIITSSQQQFITCNNQQNPTTNQSQVLHAGHFIAPTTPTDPNIVGLDGYFQSKELEEIFKSIDKVTQPSLSQDIPGSNAYLRTGSTCHVKLSDQHMLACPPPATTLQHAVPTSVITSLPGQKLYHGSPSQTHNLAKASDLTGGVLQSLLTATSGTIPSTVNKGSPQQSAGKRVTLEQLFLLKFKLDKAAQQAVSEASRGKNVHNNLQRILRARNRIQELINREHLRHQTFHTSKSKQSANNSQKRIPTSHSTALFKRINSSRETTDMQVSTVPTYTKDTCAQVNPSQIPTHSLSEQENDAICIRTTKKQLYPSGVEKDVICIETNNKKLSSSESENDVICIKTANKKISYPESENDVICLETSNQSSSKKHSSSETENVTCVERSAKELFNSNLKCSDQLDEVLEIPTTFAGSRLPSNPHKTPHYSELPSVVLKDGTSETNTAVPKSVSLHASRIEQDVPEVIITKVVPPKLKVSVKEEKEDISASTAAQVNTAIESSNTAQVDVAAREAEVIRAKASTDQGDLHLKEHEVVITRIVPPKIKRTIKKEKEDRNYSERENEPIVSGLFDNLRETTNLQNTIDIQETGEPETLLPLIPTSRIKKEPLDLVQSKITPTGKAPAFKKPDETSDKSLVSTSPSNTDARASVRKKVAEKIDAELRKIKAIIEDLGLTELDMDVVFKSKKSGKDSGLKNNIAVRTEMTKVMEHKTKEASTQTVSNRELDQQATDISSKENFSCEKEGITLDQKESCSLEEPSCETSTSASVCQPTKVNILQSEKDSGLHSAIQVGQIRNDLQGKAEEKLEKYDSDPSCKIDLVEEQEPKMPVTSNETNTAGIKQRVKPFQKATSLIDKTKLTNISRHLSNAFKGNKGTTCLPLPETNHMVEESKIISRTIMREENAISECESIEKEGDIHQTNRNSDEAKCKETERPRINEKQDSEPRTLFEALEATDCVNKSYERKQLYIEKNKELKETNLPQQVARVTEDEISALTDIVNSDEVRNKNDTTGKSKMFSNVEASYKEKKEYKCFTVTSEREAVLKVKRIVPNEVKNTCNTSNIHELDMQNHILPKKLCDGPLSDTPICESLGSTKKEDPKLETSCYSLNDNLVSTSDLKNEDCSPNRNKTLESLTENHTSASDNKEPNQTDPVGDNIRTHNISKGEALDNKASSELPVGCLTLEKHNSEFKDCVPSHQLISTQSTFSDSNDQELTSNSSTAYADSKSPSTMTARNQSTSENERTTTVKCSPSSHNRQNSLHNLANSPNEQHHQKPISSEAMSEAIAESDDANHLLQYQETHQTKNETGDDTKKLSKRKLSSTDADCNIQTTKRARTGKQNLETLTSEALSTQIVKKVQQDDPVMADLMKNVEEHQKLNLEIEFPKEMELWNVQKTTAASGSTSLFQTDKAPQVTGILKRNTQNLQSSLTEKDQQPVNVDLVSRKASSENSFICDQEKKASKLSVRDYIYRQLKGQTSAPESETSINTKTPISNSGTPSLSAVLQEENGSLASNMQNKTIITGTEHDVNSEVTEWQNKVELKNTQQEDLNKGSYQSGVYSIPESCVSEAASEAETRCIDNKTDTAEGSENEKLLSSSLSNQTKPEVKTDDTKLSKCSIHPNWRQCSEYHSRSNTRADVNERIERLHQITAGTHNKCSTSKINTDKNEPQNRRQNEQRYHSQHRHRGRQKSPLRSKYQSTSDDKERSASHDKQRESSKASPKTHSKDKQKHHSLGTQRRESRHTQSSQSKDRSRHNSKDRHRSPSKDSRRSLQKQEKNNFLNTHTERREHKTTERKRHDSKDNHRHSREKTSHSRDQNKNHSEKNPQESSLQSPANPTQVDKSKEQFHTKQEVEAERKSTSENLNKERTETEPNERAVRKHDGEPCLQKKPGEDEQCTEVSENKKTVPISKSSIQEDNSSKTIKTSSDISFAKNYTKSNRISDDNANEFSQNDYHLLQNKSAKQSYRHVRSPESDFDRHRNYSPKRQRFIRDDDLQYEQSHFHSIQPKNRDEYFPPRDVYENDKVDVDRRFVKRTFAVTGNWVPAQEIEEPRPDQNQPRKYYHCEREDYPDHYDNYYENEQLRQPKMPEERGRVAEFDRTPVEPWKRKRDFVDPDINPERSVPEFDLRFRLKEKEQYQDRKRDRDGELIDSYQDRETDDHFSKHYYSTYYRDNPDNEFRDHRDDIPFNDYERYRGLYERDQYLDDWSNSDRRWIQDYNEAQW